MRRSLIAFGLLLSGCVLLDAGPVPSSAETASDCAGTEPDIAVLCEAIDLVERRYVDPIPDQALVDAARSEVATLGSGGTAGDLECDLGDSAVGPICEAIDLTDAPVDEGVEAALVGIATGALDSNSAYLDPEARALVTEETTGEVEGIGALVSAEDLDSQDADDPESCAVVSETCRLVVVSTFPASPAREAGLLPGDIIGGVDGTSVMGLHVDEVTALVRGPAGTDVVLTVIRDGEPLDIRITRAAVEIPVTQAELVDSVGYLRLNLFTGNSGAQVRSELEALLEAGAESIVLDLRDNPGGTLNASIDVAGEFLAEGPVVITESPEETKTFEVSGDGVAIDPAIDVVILLNRGSASASEVVAGVLEETGRATLVGENSFGKNTVQQRFTLSNDGALKLTVARWLTPSGHDFGNGGITPNVELDLPFDLTVEALVEQVLDAL